MEGEARAEVPALRAPGEESLAFLDAELIAAAWDRAGSVVEEALTHETSDAAQSLRSMVRVLGARGLLDLIASAADGGRFETISWRAVCLARERLGYSSPLLELAFAMQGLGSHPISAHGSPAQRARWLPKVLSGEHVAAFALTEPEAGSDLGGIRATARRDGDSYVLDGHKILISNAGVADIYTFFAATGASGERRRLSAFVLASDAEGLRTTPTRVLGGHPLGELFLREVRVPIDARLGEEGDGLGIALGTLHRFRATVGAAALGLAQRALDESLQHVQSRRQFEKKLAEQQAVQMALADMACELSAARMLVYHAAALADAVRGREREALAASMAKLVATESASRIVDRAVQLHGGRGVMLDHPVARLYEDVRALRIYEGASDIQRLLIARHLLAEQ